MFKSRLKWWQTGLIGALIGLGFFYSQYAVPRHPASNRIQQVFFEACLNRSDGPGPFKDLVITPQLNGMYKVTGLYFSYETHAFHKIDIEVSPSVNAKGAAGASPPLGTPFMTVMRKYATQFFWIRYEYQWWREPSLLIWVYPVTGALLFGGVIPFLTFLWPGARPTDPEKRYDIDRFSKNSQDAASSPVVSTTAKSEQLDAAISAAQQASSSTADSNAGLRAGSQAVPIRKLDATPLVEPSPTVAETEKDFDGEFYPTEIHHDESKNDSEK